MAHAQEVYQRLRDDTVTETDRLQHFLFDAFGDGRHPYHEESCGFFREVDQLAATFLQRAQACGDIEIVALSDHGFGPIKREIYLNPILKKFGYFSLEKAPTRNLANISPQSRAFALDPSRIYIHQQGKYFKGRVGKGDMQMIREDLKQLFESYEVGGEKVIRKAYFQEELYSGAQMAAAPDLVLLSNPGFDLKGGLEKEQETGLSHFTGMHRQDNAFFAGSRGEPAGSPLTIFDIKALLYRLLAT